MPGNNGNANFMLILQMKFKLEKARFQECIRDSLKGMSRVGGGVDKTEY